MRTHSSQQALIVKNTWKAQLCEEQRQRDANGRQALTSDAARKCHFVPIS